MKSIYPFLCVLLACLCSCTSPSRENHTTSKTLESSMFLCKTDTVAVTGLVSQFLSYYKTAKYADAVAMLYNHPLNHEAPELLDNDQLTSTIATLKALPITNYKISSIEFRRAEDTTVKCVLYMKDDKHVGLVFSPVRYLGQWKLCLENN